MAKVILPALSGQASGKIGDVVFFRRHGTNVARIRVKPSNPKTIKQQVVRHNLSALAQAWKGNGNLVLQDDASGSITGTPNAYYVNLRKWDDVAMAYTEFPFIVLNDTERQAWVDYANTQGKPAMYGRLYFIGDNQKLLMTNQNPIRIPA